MEGHGDIVRALACTPQGLVFTASPDRTARANPFRIAGLQRRVPQHVVVLWALGNTGTEIYTAALTAALLPSCYQDNQLAGCGQPYLI